MYRLEVEDHFSSAHQLRGYQGKCENLHGHNWKILIAIEGEELDHLGMLMDFTEVKAISKEIMAELDHKFLNELPPFDEINPTSELIARHIACKIAPRMREGIKVAAVKVWESERCSATYLP